MDLCFIQINFERKDGDMQKTNARLLAIFLIMQKTSMVCNAPHVMTFGDGIHPGSSDAG